jgi:hypothetical protein
MEQLLQTHTEHSVHVTLQALTVFCFGDSVIYHEFKIFLMT